MTGVRVDYTMASRLVAYDSLTGQFTWRDRTPDLFPEGNRTAEVNCRRWNTRYAGKPTFRVSDRGYFQGTFFNRKYWAHRVAWLLHYRCWPSNHIDHIDGNGQNNAINNLRDATPTLNMRNQKKRSDNKSGVTGVTWSDRESRWGAYIHVNGHSKFLGYHDSIDQAAAARELAKKEHGYAARHGL